MKWGSIRPDALGKKLGAPAADLEEEAMGKCFEQSDIFPHLKSVIEALCERDGEATHVAIEAELMQHPKGSVLIERAIRRCPEFSKELMAGNMLDWLSHKYTTGDLRLFETRFQRHRYNDTWTYSRK